MSTRRRQLLTRDEAEAIRVQFPGVPQDYLDHLLTVGWGEQNNGRMLYSGPISPAKVYGDELAESSVVLLGDDTMGYCFGIDLQNDVFGEFSPRGEWEPWPKEKVFSEYAC